VLTERHPRIIQAMTASRSQGEIGIERICQLAGMSGYYRYWQPSASGRNGAAINLVVRLRLGGR